MKSTTLDEYWHQLKREGFCMRHGMRIARKLLPLEPLPIGTILEVMRQQNEKKIPL